jgi:hypothetical protein
MVQETLPKSTS